jgi:hypothetical protein
MAIWEKLDPLAAEFEREAAGTVTAVGDGRDWRGYSIRRLTELASLAAGTRDSVRARDAQGAARRVIEVGRDVALTQRFVEREQVRAAPPQGVAAVGAGLRKVGGLQAQISSLLDSLLAVPGESNPALIEATRALGEQQGGLQDRQRVLGQEVRTIEAALPVATGEASKAMSGAGVAMERARGALEQGVAVSGEGHQRRAVDLVRETAAHLQQSMEDQAQMQQSMSAMNGEKRAESGDEPGDSPSTVEPEIPAPELFKTAEDYRRALLEGMAGEVPEEFQALKKRFYEDLVRQ